MTNDDDLTFSQEPSTGEPEAAPAVSSEPGVPVAAITAPPTAQPAPVLSAQPVNRVAYYDTGFGQSFPDYDDPKPAIEPTQRLVENPTGRCAVLDATGHTELTWDTRDQASVDAARKKFDDLLGRRYLAFKVNDDGTKGEQIRAFDPEIEDMILIPPMQGG